MRQGVMSHVSDQVMEGLVRTTLQLPSLVGMSSVEQWLDLLLIRFSRMCIQSCSKYLIWQAWCSAKDEWVEQRLTGILLVGVTIPLFFFFVSLIRIHIYIYIYILMWYCLACYLVPCKGHIYVLTSLKYESYSRRWNGGHRDLHCQRWIYFILLENKTYVLWLSWVHGFTRIYIQISLK